ncbi:anti-repressor SinI family protein [Thalassobacillus sp. CUG 92003]|nr:anti-repressor SinI family protein [Thalassobacillus sp. CUG 92003]
MDNTLPKREELDRDWIILIKEAKEAGLTVEEIRHYLTRYST